MAELGVGIVGCGNISTAYLRLAPLFRGFRIVAVSDAQPAVAEARGKEFGVPALPVPVLMADPSVDIVLNLTIPSAHFAISRAALQAGKHVYSEKPLVLELAEGEALRALAASRGLRVGAAPDTFLGGAHQQVRAEIDAGGIGRVVGATAHVMSHGMEDWHPNPDFFYLPGGGPMLDVGPYYVTNLIQLLGPVRRVAALAGAASATRRIGSEARAGEEIPVKTPTNIHALLDFASGAAVTLSASWDVWHHRHSHMEIYGSEGTLYAPDPNFFGGTVERAGSDGEAAPLAGWEHPFGRPNDADERNPAPRANYRAAGLADMAAAIAEERPHRCSLELALHAIDVMTAVLASGERGEFVATQTSCERPAPLGPEQAAALLA